MKLMKMPKIYLIVLLSLGFTTGNSTSASASDIPITDSNLYILDMSKSLNTSELWLSLRQSIQEKLIQPFGNPKAKSYSAKPASDITISTISKISANSPTFTIVSKRDSQEIWGVVEKNFPKSNEARKEQIIKALFAPGGVWMEQSKIFSTQKVNAPTKPNCERAMISQMKLSNWIKNTSVSIQADLASNLCKKLIDIANKYNEVDKYLSNSTCKASDKCSDVTGAILKSTRFASDIYDPANKSSSGLCIAIASDMLNDAVSIKPKTLLDSRFYALNSKSTVEANSAGVKAAKSVGVKFPSGLKTKVVIVGMGTGPKPLPLDRTSFLDAYWNGFFTSAGISQSSQTQSINKACA